MKISKIYLCVLQLIFCYTQKHHIFDWFGDDRDYAKTNRWELRFFVNSYFKNYVFADFPRNRNLQIL